ncbi:MAG: hypothetical protein HY804_13685 [Nitrospinae bacterium]|nr:hypothetical protein [Nitrospinota bacterium]
MTIAICLSVNDGVVLASDSASTLSDKTGVLNVYNNADKIFNLYKGLPVGAVTWGAGSIGRSSISTLMKDLRRRFTSSSDPKWKLDKPSYEMRGIAEKVKNYFYDELYCPEFESWPEKPSLGFIVTGYSANKTSDESYLIEINSGICSGVNPVRENHAQGIIWRGQPEAINRLLLGHSGDFPQILSAKLGVPEDQIAVVMNIITEGLQAPLLISPMPVQDAIDLARFLVDVTINYLRFSPGAPTVAGPIEIAAITKHEGFKWIQRKHYYDPALNPRYDPSGGSDEIHK